MKLVLMAFASLFTVSTAAFAAEETATAPEATPPATQTDTQTPTATESTAPEEATAPIAAPAPEPAKPKISGDQALVNAETYHNNVITLINNGDFAQTDEQIDNIKEMLPYIEEGALSTGERRIRLRGSIKSLSERLEKLRTATEMKDVPACRYELKRTGELMTMVRLFTR